ncbi:pyrimidine/purine nucleoside phosphorylase [Pedobacter chitinilyticus]|uniref:Pyrimidine/purine nucleoside phosphorylase n=1 Tax=Pedobacter chitinilyticus TaxID=2233776 RepID=A0A3S3R583_9SPHI|nr:pyrimidine/purine nucleoside phosphorylase [Pedobacter chitinilyticus]RWU05689.1 pyrimidine/purine nucleoside phosphorylase [Pedobacter chitinilyticus]
MIAVNEYFDGAVKSLAYENNGKSTVGVINAGEYEFGTSTHETMTVVEGAMEVLLPSQNEWRTYLAGQQFEVPAHTSFKVKAAQQVAYLCKYK